MLEKIINTGNLVKKYGHKLALDNINFDVNEGEIFGFLGPSGSGKTTTINIITGQENPTSGNISVFGKPLDQITSKDQANMGIISDGNGYYELLSLYDNLLFYAKIYNYSLKKLDYLLDKLELKGEKKTKAKNLSTGMKQRMFLIRALIKQPKILFLDEPTSGLDPVTTQIIHNLLFELKDKGVTIFLTTHNMNEAHLLSDRLLILYRGKIVEYGSPEDIIYRNTREQLVTVKYQDGKKDTIRLNELDISNKNNNILSIHSNELTLEEVFIQLTGEALHV